MENTRRSVAKENRGYFGIGVYHPKTRENIGTLWRSAYQLGADYIYTIGHRYGKQESDTYKTYRHIPLIQFETLKDFQNSVFYDCRVVCIEFCDRSKPLPDFVHPRRCTYLLGSEDKGFPKEILDDPNYLFVEIPSVRMPSYNVAMAGTLVMYDRLSKLKDNK